jgi:alkanesulfonate monooxygenase SsuD/methylene tetrahydromethanopterin reductase-like flavin-dependent oxidoreductase (luciferase family)
VRVGVLMLPTDPWPETLARARRLEALGFDHLWTYDHLSWRRYRERPWFAAVPWLTGLAAATERVRLGPMVTSPNFRHPLTLAKDAIALDHVSNGRLVLGVGAGGVGFDSTVFGEEPLPPRDRVARFQEFVAALDLLLREPAASHRGRYYTIDDARLVPGCVQQPRLPLAIAAAGRRSLGIVARHADSWITYGAPDDAAGPAAIERAVREQIAGLERACDTIGRDPSTIDRIYLIGNTAERPTAGIDAFREFASRYAVLGFTDLVFHHPRADDPVWDDPVEIVDTIAGALPELHALGN